MNWQGFLDRTPETARPDLSGRCDLVEPPRRPHSVQVVAGAAHELILLESSDQRDPVCHNAVIAPTPESNADRQLLELLASVHELAHVSLLHENSEVGHEELVVALGAGELHDQSHAFDLLNDVGTLTLALGAFHGCPFGLALPFGAVRCGCSERTGREHIGPRS